MMADWVKKAPTAVVVTLVIMCGVVALGILGSFVALTVTGHDTSDFRMWINTVGQALVYPILGVSTLASVQAARSASKAEDQTNGHLAAKDLQIEAMRRQLDARKTTGR